MKFVIKNPKDNITNLTRRIGYFFITPKRYIEPKLAIAPKAIYRAKPVISQDDKTNELSFIRPLEKGGYPRFHLYIKINSETQEIIFNLHLDQKRPVYPHTKRTHTSSLGVKDASVRYGVGVYKGAPAHAGEYEGKVVEAEVERIKQILEK